jgi:hypothetical protein
MDQLQFAIRQYQELYPERPRNLYKDLRDDPKFRTWLDEDVLPVLDSYSRRPRFREYASWPIRSLGAGADTEERRLIDTVDAGLKEAGELLVALCMRKATAEKLSQRFPSRTVVTGGEEVIGGGEPQLSARSYGTIDELKMEIAQARQIASRAWGDLVDVRDFFEPVQRFTVETDDGGSVLASFDIPAGLKSKPIQHGDGIVSMNPRLLPVGNFIVRRLLQRIDQSMATLSRLRGKYLAVHRQQEGRKPQQHQKFEQCWKTLESAVHDLKTDFQPVGEMKLRDSCIVLAQVWGAWRDSADLTWLGLPEAVVESGKTSLKFRVGTFRGPEMLDRIAAALQDLLRLYQGESAAGELEEAIASGGLVIDQQSGKAYWKGNVLPIDLSTKSGELLVQLATKARHGGDVGRKDLYGDECISDGAMSTTKGRLMQDLKQSDLSMLIKPGREPKSYRLNLEPQKIVLF